MSGYLALSDSFKAFYLETIERLNTECLPKVKTPLSNLHSLFVVRLNNNVQSLVGAERLALHGYPLQAYTIHRNTFDNAVLTAAILQKISDFYVIEGIDPTKQLDSKELKKRRKKAEREVMDKMLGKDSGLSCDTIREMQKLGDSYDLEVHGSHLSIARAVDFLKGSEPLSILPVFQKMEFALHMNRFVEIAWIVHRLLPAIQPPEAPLVGDWPKKWAILDDSFEVVLTSITEECEKKFGIAVIEFVKSKLPFNSGSVFPL
jgi:hypothetical protein